MRRCVSSFTELPDTATCATVDGMLSAGAQPTMVADMLHGNNIMVSTRDVYNM